MSTITVETECGTRQWYDNRSDAEECKRRHRERCDECGEDDVHVAVDPDQSTLRSLAVDGPGGIEETAPDTGSASGPASATPSRDRPSGPTSPSDRDGSERPGDAEYTDIAVRAEAITTAGETDHEYAEFKATAWRKDEGPENGYSGHATARALEDRRGIEHRLNEVAETRAMTRAVAWAAGQPPTDVDWNEVALDGAADGPAEGV